jgi:hypothetical protein
VPVQKAGGKSAKFASAADAKSRMSSEKKWWIGGAGWSFDGGKMTLKFFVNKQDMASFCRNG